MIQIGGTELEVKIADGDDPLTPSDPTVIRPPDAS